MSPRLLDSRLYLDHAATTPMSAAAKAAVIEGMERWANPSSPHADGRVARAALEDARARIGAALGWDGELLFTSGASEAIAIAVGRTKAARIVTSPVEHDAVLRLTPDAPRLSVDLRGQIMMAELERDTLFAIQHVNNETGVIQSFENIVSGLKGSSSHILHDCAQSAGKIDLPPADLIAVSAHKFGGPPGIGALLVKDLALLKPSGGQERGYRAGTENLPAALGMAAALEEGNGWMTEAARLRALLDKAITEASGVVVAANAPRIATIASYRMPGVSARAQLIQFDMMGISVSAGSACSSGTLKASHVLTAMGWNETEAGEVVRVSFGRQTSEADIGRFIEAWTRIAAKGRA